MLEIKTILHPTDFSPSSQPALELACALARDYGARLILLHVLERPVMAYTGVLMAPPPPPPPEEERQALRAQLAKLVPADAKIKVEHRLEEGEPVTAILQLAEETKCDVIAIGTHGRTGLGRLLMGSVAEKIVRAAPCPVLTVRMPTAEGASTTGS